MEISRDSALTALVRVRGGQQKLGSALKTQDFRGALFFTIGGVVETDSQRRARREPA
ncbi:hypothetical protein ACO9S2_01545 [Nitrospira sp. NS4]|uniref:hypothetical protein n=1 Tax=Nitrospira sp. NS4 TaxID=3414498 RepID=UPI003C2C94BA